jgi:glutamyl-tRNA synthetase
VHGVIEFPNDVIEDFVALRSDHQPTYHLSVVVDDIDMRITHVIRGDDHISNTPKQVLLYEAFGSATPAFAHVPLILGTDKKRLSKRHGATSVMEYQRLGYLPEAMVNFLALLGWSPGSDEEIFTRDELVARFSLEGISGGNAVFNPEKLDWMNAQHIQRLPAEEIIVRLEPLLRERGLWRPRYEEADRGWLAAVVELFRPRLKKLEQFVHDARPLLADSLDYDGSAVERHLSNAALRPALEDLSERYEGLIQFDASALEQMLRSAAEAHGLKAGLLIHATRVAVTGRANSPGLFDVLELIGKTKVVNRLRHACSMLSV